MSNKRPTNNEIADLLEEIAELLEAQSANRFRIQAYQDAAGTVRAAENPLVDLVRKEGEKALQMLPDIGKGIAGVINDYVHRGQSQTLETLQSETSPIDLFEQVPGIGKVLASRIVQELEISTLPELEQAAHDGRLLEIEGFGTEKVKNVQISLAGILSTAAQRARRQASENAESSAQPRVQLLLEVDEEYQRKAKSGQLPTITPKRFNPEGKAWLPVLNTERAGWEFTALFSNTAQAHELDKTNDWVVLYYKRNGEENQATVVTETKGPMKGKRVVRGREDESEAYFQNL